MDRQTHRWTDGWTDRQTDTQTDTQTEKKGYTKTKRGVDMNLKDPYSQEAVWTAVPTETPACNSLSTPTPSKTSARLSHQGWSRIPDGSSPVTPVTSSSTAALGRKNLRNRSVSNEL